MLELTSPDSQRLLTFPLKVVVVGHQVDVRHRDVVILGDWAGGKPGEPAHRQLWLGRDESKGRFCLLVGIWAGVRPIYGSCRAIIAKSHLLALKLAEEELACDASYKKNTGVGTELQGLDCKPWGKQMNRFGQGHSPGIVTKRVKAADPAKRGPLVHRV